MTDTAEEAGAGGPPLAPPRPGNGNGRSGGRELGSPKDDWSQAICSGVKGDGFAMDFAERKDEVLDTGSGRAAKNTGCENTQRGNVANCPRQNSNHNEGTCAHHVTRVMRMRARVHTQ